MMNPWLALALLFAANGLWVLLTRALSSRMAPELSRKLFHAGSGVILLSLPWLFEEPWPVLIWAGVSLAAMVVLLLVPGLKQRLAGNVYEVDRVSYGDFYFIIGVAALFFLAHEVPYTYFVPLTMLAFADATSAVIGKRFGRHKYEATDGRKSIEGSAAFFIVAFIATLIWLPTHPGLELWQGVLIGLILGFVVMLLEAIAWRGLDNLLIPLGGFLLLVTYLEMSTLELGIHLVVAGLLVSFVFGWRRRTTLNDAALIAGALFGYIAWTVPGKLFGSAIYSPVAWAWMAMPIATFLAYNLLFAPRLVEQDHEVHNVEAVFSAVFAGAVWLYLAFYYADPRFVYPFAVSFAAVVLNMWMEQRMVQRKRTRRREISYSVAIGLGMVGIAVALVLQLRTPGTEAGLLALLLVGLAVLGILLAMILRLLAEGLLAVVLAQDWRWHVRGLASLAGSLLAALALLHGGLAG